MSIAAVKTRYTNMRTAFRKSVVNMSKYNAMPPSGSGVKKTKKPSPYVYSAELSFLVDIFQLETTEDSLKQEDVSLTNK